MARRVSRPIFVLLFLALTAFTPRAHAGVLLEGRVGVAGPVQGDIPSFLGLDIGPAFGLTAGFELNDQVDLDVRFDAVWLFGEADASGSGPFGGSLSANADASSSTYAITFGPSFHTEESGTEVYLGIHPGLYLAQFELDGRLDAEGPIPIVIKANVESDTSVDFGFNVEAGVRFPVGDTVKLGAELAYHFDLIRDLADDEAGALVGSVVVGWRQ